MRFERARKGAHGLFTAGAGGRLGWYADYFIAALIIANVVAVALETVEPLYEAYGMEFYLFEAASVAIFTVEYLGRLWSATELEEYDHPVWGRLRFALSPYMIVDLLAILPFYLGAVADLRALRALRMLRFLRLLKLGRYAASIDLFVTALRIKKQELILTTAGGAVSLFAASTLMYFAERNAQPEVFSSIPASMWWGVVTLTTVGYGDMYPVTTLGRIIASTLAIFGVGFVAVPASILAHGFIEATRQDTTACPHCGEEILEKDLDEIVEEG